MFERDKLSIYKQVDVISRVEEASPHRLIQILYESAISAVAEAKGALARGDVVLRGKQITRAMNILAGLRDSLDHKLETPLPHDLDRLYEYMQGRLQRAHLDAEAELLNEVLELLKTVKSGWDDIAPESQ